MTSTKTECLKDTVIVLINAVGDTDNSVNNVLIKSLTKIANIYPNEVIDVFCDFYKNTIKVNSAQLSNTIKVLEQTCVNQVKKLKPETVADLANAMLRAMTENTVYDPAVQMGASSVLVAVSHEYLDLILRLLINQLYPASIPHYTIVHTLGTLAAVNTQGVVPHIKEILGKMLPLLTIIKLEGVKQAFAYAFGHFAVAIAEQIGDSVDNENITSIKENFVTEFSIIFDVLYNQWLVSHEPKVTESILEALGPITRLISERQFNETVNKFVLSLLLLYRKTALNHYYITQCVSYLLSPSSLNPKLNLNDNVITAVNHAMFNLVLLEPDYDQPQTVKNHFEVLRCLDHMAGQFPDQTIEGLLVQCKNNQEKDRMKAIIVLTHLTTSSQVFIDNFAAKFISILNVMISMEQGIRMKKLLVKAIVGLVYRNCISTTEDFEMIKFIIRHCGFTGAPNVPNSEVIDLQDTCKSSLILMCNTVTSVRAQLRYLLLKTLTEERYTNSMGTVSLCLTSLLQNNSDVIMDEQTEKEIEDKCCPDLVFIRCLMYIADPTESEKNKNLLIFLEEYSDEVHKNLKNFCPVEIQRLLKFVEKNESDEQWHAMLLDLLVSAIEQVNSNKWVETIATLLSQQVLLKEHPPTVRGISLQYLAVLLCHMTNAALVEKNLKIIMFALKSIPMASCGYVSKAIGIASRQHGEAVLNELDTMYKENEARRSGKILSFLAPKSAKNEAEIAVVKYAAISSYGKIANECLDVHVLSRLGENVTKIIHETLKSNPPFDLCRACITTLYEISKALQPAPHHNVTLRNRWQLLNAVLSQINNINLDDRNVELYPIIVKASKALTKLQKGILPEERNTILRVMFNSIFGELSSFKSKYEVERNGEKNDMLAKTLNDSLTLLHHLIRELIIQSTCLSTIDDLVSLLMEWIRHENDEIRTASSLILQVVFDAYIKNVRLNYETPSKFGQMGYLLGILVPGVTDTNFPVRLTTVDCIKLIIQIQDLYDGHIIEANEAYMARLAHLQNNILTNDTNMIYEYCLSLCDTIAPKIPHQHNMQFIESLLEGYDSQEFKCVGISAVLERFFTKKGQELYQNIERIMDVVISTMDRVDDEARSCLMLPLISLTKCHSNAVTAVLLAQKLPLKPSVISCWRSLAQDEWLSKAIIENFLRLMTSIELYEDPYHITENHIAALQPLTLISALGEMLQESAMRPICNVKFPELFSVLFTTLACYLEAEAPAYTVPSIRGQERFGFIPNREAIKLSPAKITVNTFSAFLERADCQEVREACSLCLSVEHGEGGATLGELAALLAGALSRTQAARLPACAARLAHYARAPLPPQRCAAATLLADLLHYRCNDNPVVTETVLATLSAGWTDEAGRVRAACLRGAAHLARLPLAKRAAATRRALLALSQGVDGTSAPSPMENVPLAAIQGLSRLLTEADQLDKEFDRELLSISQKIRPFMNTECYQLREGSIRLFGIIASRVRSEALVGQALSSLPCFLLHLCDPNPAVIRASKFTVREVLKVVEAPRASAFAQKHLVEEGRLFLEEFLSALLRLLGEECSRALAAALPPAANYLHAHAKHMPDPAHAPLLLGLLYAELHRLRQRCSEHAELDPEVSLSARSRLVQLLKEPSAQVRQAAAFALAHLTLVCAEEEPLPYNSTPISPITPLSPNNAKPPNASNTKDTKMAPITKDTPIALNIKTNPIANNDNSTYIAPDTENNSIVSNINNTPFALEETAIASNTENTPIAPDTKNTPITPNDDNTAITPNSNNTSVATRIDPNVIETSNAPFDDPLKSYSNDETSPNSDIETSTENIDLDSPNTEVK